MRRTLRVGQAIDLLFQSDEENVESSSSESGGDEFEDPDFVVENTSEDEQAGPSSTPAPTPTTSRRRSSPRLRVENLSEDEQAGPSPTPTPTPTPTTSRRRSSPRLRVENLSEDEQAGTSTTPAPTPTTSRRRLSKSVRVENLSEDEQAGPSTTPAPTPTTSRGRSSQRGRGQTKSRSPAQSAAQSAAQPQQSSEPWRTESDPDTAPQVSRFMPRRTPGPQVDFHSTYTPKDLFLFYFAADTLRTLCRNTNKQATINQRKGSKYQWTDIDVEELHKFLGLLMYTSLVTLPSIQDYWKQNHILSVPFPATVMPRDRFRTISWNIHLSDPEEDVKNDQLKGTQQHDKLYRVRPLMDEIRTACKAYYHPKKELSVDERMVATKAKTGMTQYMKDKPTKWGIKLFVLAESKNGYTLDFNVYVGKAHTPSVHGLSYDAVMDLIHPSHLGTGYHIYMDNFYTSPKLFLSLAGMKFGACGTYRSNRKGCPTDRQNALTNKSQRGSVRWIREDPLVFVKWMDTREVSMCSTIHPAFSGEAVKRKVKEGGHWSVKDIPCPTPIIAYNQHMGGVDLSDQLLQYYSTHRRNSRWYRTLFLHFVDMATTNAYILHCEISAAQQVTPLTHKLFLAELVAQLCGVNPAGVPIQRSNDHVPVAISLPTEAKAKATQGRRNCQQCHQVDNKRMLTPWKCKACDVPLCVILDRNCFEEWHK
ncbi:piggyBac transposable element-derived protein 4-like isoform X3 [Hypomesus transpacificus]|uniref:piggyBac transposable element-derived protein 4-like isoform X3 n=1 Tax=Hypomesus transpacificus TaxID=137520 RepID=UPI001F07FE14|nr:piggyBac transposable element-derived protein 4-like isoform X3 [Hypomesus transpacificus]